MSDHGRRKGRKDDNQDDIVGTLRVAGYYVIDIHSLGNGIPDLLVVGKDQDRTLILAEVKQKSGTFTPDEKEFLRVYPGYVATFYDTGDALRKMHQIDKGNLKWDAQ